MANGRSKRGIIIFIKHSMKRKLLAVAGILLAGLAIISFKRASKTIVAENSIINEASSNALYSLSIKSLDGSRTISMSEFKGKKILCVNVASECGYTPQYQDLQKLYDTYKEKLVIIGFPCNQFGYQESGSAEEIQTFCKKNYGVTFVLTEKIDVKGSNQHPIYKWLCNKSENDKSDASVKWNFNKFLVDENGTWIAYFPSSVKPLSEEITSKLK
jgi:glutathione peroxidase